MLRQRGFSLVELMIVIAIIAILMAILFPVFNKVRANTDKAKCIAQLSELGRALEMYRQDHQFYPDRATSPTMALVSAGLLSRNSLNCPRDPDEKNDTYAKYYNYYGYKGGETSPTPFENFTDAKATYATLVNPKTGKPDFWHPTQDTPDSAFPGLANPNAKVASGDTIVTACEHHVGGGRYVILRLSGVTDYTKPYDPDFWAKSLPAK